MRLHHITSVHQQKDQSQWLIAYVVQQHQRKSCTTSTAQFQRKSSFSIYLELKKSGAVQYWRCGDERRRLSHLCSLASVATSVDTVKPVWPFSLTGHCQAGSLLPVWPHCHCHLLQSLSSLTGHHVVCTVVWSRWWCGVAHCGLTVTLLVQSALVWPGTFLTVTFLTAFCLSPTITNKTWHNHLLTHTCASCPRNGTSSFGGLPSKRRC